MALIKCSHCGKEYSDKAVACPECKAINILAQIINQDTEGHSIKNQANANKSDAYAFVETSESKFNTRLFKKIIAIYMLLALFLCVFLPMDSLYVVNQFNADSEVTESYIANDLGFGYFPIWKAGATIVRNSRLTSAGYGPYYKGIIENKIKILYVIAEITALTFLFAGASYILCRKD